MSLALNAITEGETEYSLPLYGADGALNGAHVSLPLSLSLISYLSHS
jgi:hypothetical protein